LAPFKTDEIKDYLNSRMRTCGYRSEDIFSASAVSAISKYSKGLIRRINILADKALLATYAENMHKVTSSQVKTAARDSEFIKNRTFLTPVMVSMVVLIFFVLAGGFIFPAKISQGLQAIQLSLDADTKPAGIQIDSGQTDIGQMDSGQIISESANENILAIDNSVTEDQSQEEQIETVYLPEDGKDIPNVDEEVSLVLSEPVAIGLTDKEFERLKQQLVEIPPEVKLNGRSEMVCEKCASIIYRPIL